MGGPLKIRRFRISDLARVLEIEKLSFLNDAWDAEMVVEFSERYPELFVVAGDDRTIAGYALTCITGRRAELASIAVDPANRVRGIGSALMNYTFRALRRRGVGSWHLMVRTDNEPAIGFYKRLGFVRTRTVRNYYEDGSDAWRMLQKLPC